MSKSCQGCLWRRTSFHLPSRTALFPSCSQKIGSLCASGFPSKAGRRLTPCMGSIARPLNWRGYGVSARSTAVAMMSIRCVGCFSQAAAATRRDARGPVGDERGADPALVREVLVAAEGRVRQRGPIHAQVDVRLRPADRPLAASDARRAALGVAAVVAQEQDQGVVQHPAVLQPVDQRSHRDVDPLDHRRVNRHHLVESLLPVGEPRLPGGHVRRPRRHAPSRVDQAQGNLLRVAPVAEDVPAFQVLPLIFGDRLGRRRSGKCTAPCAM